MAVQAPAHLHGLRFVGERHFVDSPMTGRAADTLLNVDAVVEIHEPRQVVDPVPHDRLTVSEALADGLQGWTLGPDFGVAIHARLGRRHAREG